MWALSKPRGNLGRPCQLGHHVEHHRASALSQGDSNWTGHFENYITCLGIICICVTSCRSIYLSMAQLTTTYWRWSQSTYQVIFWTNSFLLKHFKNTATTSEERRASRLEEKLIYQRSTTVFKIANFLLSNHCLHPWQLCFDTFHQYCQWLHVWINQRSCHGHLWVDAIKVWVHASYK